MNDKAYELSLDIERRLTLALARLAEADNLLERVCDWLPVDCPERKQLYQEIVAARTQKYVPVNREFQKIPATDSEKSQTNLPFGTLLFRLIEQLGEDPGGCPRCGAFAGACKSYPNCDGAG